MNGATPSKSSLVSILINNYNYGGFLREAIDSALNQTHPYTEVIVIDDGSTDDSREIIASYGDRIIPIFKEHGGQRSAFNAGFQVSRGEVICPLDSDDIFSPEKVSLVLEAWMRNPHACVVYHQLQIVNSQKNKIGKPWPRAVWCGDIRSKVERSGGWWPQPTTTGLCFSRFYLERICPVPTEFRSKRLQGLDAYLGGVAPFLGPVTGIRVPLALYRVHGKNIVPHTNDLNEYQWRVNRCITEFHALKEILDNRFNIRSSISLEDHWYYQKYQWAAGAPISIHKVIYAIIRTPALSPPMKCEEIARFFLWAFKSRRSRRS